MFNPIVISSVALCDRTHCVNNQDTDRFTNVYMLTDFDVEILLINALVLLISEFATVWYHIATKVTI